MKTLEEKRKEFIKINEILKNIDSENFEYADKKSDLLYQYQPFLISVVLGYRHDVDAAELNEITGIIFLIWGYFKDNKKIRTIKITESQFETAQKRNYHFLKYFQGEESEKEREIIVASDLDQLNSKTLFLEMFFLV